MEIFVHLDSGITLTNASLAKYVPFEKPLTVIVNNVNNFYDQLIVDISKISLFRSLICNQLLLVLSFIKLN